MPEQEIAILGGGCFWCLEAVFDRLRGVKSVESGYSGGRIENPNYRQVCDGDTGHVEVIRITFDPQQIAFSDLLDVFFGIHDPTQLNQQGNDVGEQYRSVIFFTSDAQKRAAEEKVRELRSEYAQPIVTAIEPAKPFYVAEPYHQEYFANNPRQPYCQAVVAPKVRKALEKFGDKMATAS